MVEVHALFTVCSVLETASLVASPPRGISLIHHHQSATEKIAMRVAFPAAAFVLLALQCRPRLTQTDRQRLIPPPAPLLETSLAAMNPHSLAVREASGKGRGLFAEVDIPRDTYLCDYAGERLSAEQRHKRYAGKHADHAYVVEAATLTGEPFFVDGRDEAQVSPGRWLNHAADSTDACNVYTSCEAGERLCMYTLRKVIAGEELQWAQ